MSKDTLQLPKTAFSMKANLSTKEPEILEKWEKEVKSFFSGNAEGSVDLTEMKESVANKSQYFIDYLNENRDRLSQEEIRRINDIIGKQTAAETKELLKSVENGVNDFLQRTESWLQSLEEELEK